MMQPTALSRPHVFVLLAALASLVLAAPAAAQQVNKVKPGKWNRSDRFEGWTVINTRHYQIQCQAGKEKGERLADHMEKMVHVYKRMFPGSASQFTQRPIKLFLDEAAYHGYGAPQGTGGYYTYGERELVLFDTGKWQDEEEKEGPITGGDAVERIRARLRQKMNRDRTMDTLGVAAHEGWHQYFHWYVVSIVDLPQWIDEGVGEYFYQGVPRKKGRKLVLDFSDINRYRFPTIYAAIKQGRHEPLEKFLRMDQRDYYSNPGVCYAQGWAFCYFLMECDNKRYNKVLPHYIRYIRDDSDWEKVTQLAFRGIDMEELEQDFHQFVLEDMKEKYDNPYNLTEEEIKALKKAEKEDPDEGEDAPIDLDEILGGSGEN